MIFINSLVFLISFGCLQAEEINPKVAITQVLNKWPQDFNAKNIQAVCELYAPDVVAMYQGQPDRNYDDLCDQLKASMNNAELIFHYETPTIQQILIEGDLAIVRVIWTLRISDKKQVIRDVIREKGLDIFRHEPDGSWKVIISFAYPDTNS
jgi:ketosteroid isomerase-like protein